MGFWWKSGIKHRAWHIPGAHKITELTEPCAPLIILLECILSVIFLNVCSSNACIFYTYFKKPYYLTPPEAEMSIQKAGVRSHG